MSEFSNKRNHGPTPKYDRVLSYKPLNNNFTVIAGPCSVESKDQIELISNFVAKHGATHLRGGVFWAGTYPSQNFGWKHRDLIAAYWWFAQKNKLQNIIEILDYRDIDKIAPYCSCFQVGARQMQNYTLLKEVGASGKPVFLKRNPGATIDEWLGSAEYILKEGCKELYLIERGSSAYHNDVRWTPTLHIIPSINSICNIPVVFDASHSSSRRDLVESMTLAGVAAGANGILVETHPDPKNSVSDSDQAISFDDFEFLMKKVNKIREALL